PLPHRAAAGRGRSRAVGAVARDPLPPARGPLLRPAGGRQRGGGGGTRLAAGLGRLRRRLPRAAGAAPLGGYRRRRAGRRGRPPLGSRCPHRQAPPPVPRPALPRRPARWDHRTPRRHPRLRERVLRLVTEEAPDVFGGPTAPAPAGRTSPVRPCSG